MSLIAGRNEKPIGVRLPEAVRNALDQSAARNGRSRNSEIVFRLANSLGVIEAADRTSAVGASK